MPCTSHEDCLESRACHLDGPQAGTCFDVSQVVTVVGDDELLEVLEGIQDTDVIAIHVFTTWEGDIDYFNMRFEGNVEVAIIGREDDYPLSFHGIEEDGLLQVASGAIVYVDNVIIGENPAGSGIDCDGGTVWAYRTRLDRNHEALDARGGCQAHLSRVSMARNASRTILVRGSGTSLELSNAMVAGDPDGDEPIVVEDGVATITYSTITSYESGPPTVSCNDAAQVEIRNSILLTPSATPEIDCIGASLEHSVAGNDHGSTNLAVGSVHPQWFESYLGGRLHLGESHPFEPIAVPVPGDPQFDIDGNPRDVALVGADVPGDDEWPW